MYIVFNELSLWLRSSYKPLFVMIKQKAIVVMMLILLLVIVGELLFYSYIKNGGVVRYQGLLVHAPFQYEPDIIEETRNRLIDEEHKVSLQTEEIGTVNEVKQNYTDSYNRSADLYLALAHKAYSQDPNKPVRISPYFLNKNNFRIYIVLKDGQKKEASISDIKQGDKISIKTIINIINLKTKNYIYVYSIEITK